MRRLRQKRRFWNGLGVLLAACLLFPAGARGDDNSVRGAEVNRGKMGMSYRNTGSSGANVAIGSFVADATLSLAYPAIVQATETYGIKNETSKGNGIWFLAIDESGTYRVTSSDSWGVTADIRNGQYNTTGRPEENVGFQTRTSNVWPGRPEPELPSAVEISNWRPGAYTTAANDHFPEEMVITQWSSDPAAPNATGLKATLKAYSWGHPDFDDFIVEELVFENASNRTLAEVYVATHNYWNVSHPGHHMRNWNAWFGWTRDWLEDEHIVYTEAPNYGGAHAGKKMVIQWDGDAASSPVDDTAEPFNPIVHSTQAYRALGEFYSAQYIAGGPVDVDPTDGFTNDPETGYVAPSDVENQPFSFHWWDTNETSSAGRFPRRETDPDPSVLFGKFTAATDANPAVVHDMTHSLVYGPYRLEPGQKAKVVWAYAGGHASETAGPGGEPMDYRAWNLLSDKANLRAGMDAAAAHLERARLIYRMGYDIPNQPPDVGEYRVTSNENGNVRVSWSNEVESATHPDFGDNRVAGYRIYRSGGPPVSITNRLGETQYSGSQQVTGPWDLVADIKVGQAPYATGGGYVFDDAESITGFDYWYSLVAYEDGRSSWENVNAQMNAGSPRFTLEDLPDIVQRHVRAGVQANHLTPQARHRDDIDSMIPVTAASDGSDALENEVLVVPNPWINDGVHTYGGSQRIRFVRIPRECEIFIYTTGGDLIAHIIHDGTDQDPNIAEFNWSQQILSGWTMATGVYYFTVVSQVSVHQGKTQRGSFVVIR